MVVFIVSGGVRHYHTGFKLSSQSGAVACGDTYDWDGPGGTLTYAEVALKDLM